MASQILALPNQPFDHGTMTEQNSLTGAMLTKPDILPKVNYLFGDKYYLGRLTGMMKNGLVELKKTDKISGESIGQYELQNRNVRWFIQGLMFSKSQIVTPAAAGSWLNGNRFVIGMKDNIFHEGWVLRFPTGVEARVFDEPVESNGQWIYTLQIIGSTGSMGTLHPTFDNVAGREVYFGYTSYGEGSTKGYSNQFFPQMMQEYMGVQRMAFGMTAHANSTVTCIKVEGQGDKMIWFPEQERQFMMQWGGIKEYAAWYAKGTFETNGSSNLIDKTGRVIIQGNGLFEQLKYSTHRTYTPESGQLDGNFFTHFLAQILNNSPAEKDKTVVCFTGMGGYMEFQNAMRGEIVRMGITDTSSIFITKPTKGANNSNPNYAVGAEFTQYRGLFGTNFILVRNWMFDSPLFGGLKHPRTGLNLESYKMVFLDFSEFGGSPNIQLTSLAGRSMVRKVIPGMDTPPGSPEYAFAVNGYDGFQLEYLSEGGVLVRNPYSSGIIEANIV